MDKWKVVKYIDATGSKKPRETYGICAKPPCIDGLDVYRLPKDRAELIVKCVNAHERLVEALEKTTTELAKMINGNELSDRAVMQEMENRWLLKEIGQ